MSSETTSNQSVKKALSSRPRKPKKPLEPVWVSNQAFDEARDAAEPEWLTVKEFAQDPRFGGKRDPSGLQHAIAANRCGLQQSRRTVPIQVPGRGGHLRPSRMYSYPLWRIEEWVGYKVIRRPIAAPPPTTGPLKRSVQFASPTPQEEESPPPAVIPRPRAARDLIFIPPPSQPDLETCGAESC